MNLISANLEHLDQIYALVQDTIQSVYPKYYPLEVVDFFCAHHCKENIEKDIIAGTVFLMVDRSVVIGTASYYKYHITRLYVNHRITSYNVCYTKLLRKWQINRWNNYF